MPPLLNDYARLDPGWWLTSTRWDYATNMASTHRVPVKGFDIYLTNIIPLSPALMAPKCDINYSIILNGLPFILF
jgi:hypothetical protein